jgi:hypothetical protein
MTLEIKPHPELLPCPFCGSRMVDPEGWASTDRAGPACDDCAGTADTVEIWNTRAAPLDREHLAKVFAYIWHGDLGEWEGFLSKADAFLSYPLPSRD